MSQHDFSALTAHYPDIIAVMPESFTSHQFILHLAQRHQGLYVEALYAYRASTHRGTIAPFRVVHGRLAQHLRDFPHLVQYDGEDPSSTDTFDHSQACSRWRRCP
jgi:hypothetical protein